MSASEKLSLAIGFFSGDENLVSAVNELLGYGIAVGRINLLSLASHSRNGKTPPELDSQRGRLTPAAKAFVEQTGKQVAAYEGAMRLLASTAAGNRPETVASKKSSGIAPSVDATTDAAQRPAIPPFHNGTSSLTRQADRLRLHLSTGGDVLIVQLASPAEQLQVCTTLLQHSKNDVQTHELKLTN